MSVERPTFHESWSRVAPLKPRLRTGVDVIRQRFRGELWRVLHDPASDSFFRLNEPAHHFISLLDGRCTVDHAWEVCNERHGDEAPTQGEIINLLGQLSTSNLLLCEAPGDVEALFARRRRRVAREVRSHLMSLLFVRIPLVDPDAFLGAWVGVVGRLFTRAGLILWLMAIATGLFFLAGRGGELLQRAQGLLAPGNLLTLYLSFAAVKLCHELGHAFACKRFGAVEGAGGEVHVLGVMLLVFVPVPYVDATSAWAFRDKWRRIAVGASGVMVEMFIASIAAVVWARTSQGALTHTLAYNIMFIAGVSTLLFNANPLLRYDGYYILSDLLETPNLHQRSRDALHHLVKRRLWGVKRSVDPAHTPGERPLLILFGLMSGVYRIVIYAVIIWFVSRRFLFVGVALALAAAISWVAAPLSMFIKYLATSGELERVRARAVWTTLASAGVLLIGLGLIPAPDHLRAPGVVEPKDAAVLYAPADGFILSAAPTGAKVLANQTPIITAASAELDARLLGLQARREGLIARWRKALKSDIALAQIGADQIAAIDKQIERALEEIESLTIMAPRDGVWIAPDIEFNQGDFIRRGDRLGFVIDPTSVTIRAVASQQAGPTLLNEGAKQVAIRVSGQPVALLKGTTTAILPQAQRRLPSASLGYAVGGSIETNPSDPQGSTAAERFFEVRIAPAADAALLPGQRVVVRFDLAPKPLLAQWVRSLRRLLQRRVQL